jgi:pimeloyl-ACP methyl ester carboxylesterase
VDQRVASKDGTRIAYHRQGSGPALILLGGALDDGSENAPLIPELATHFTVLNYARRGRGASGDSPPYAVEREIEDLEALIAEVGGSANLYGVSSGGMLAALYGPPPTARLATITQPTLVATSGGNDFFEQAADAVAASLPRAERRIMAGQGHVADPRMVAPVLERFFRS